MRVTTTMLGGPVATMPNDQVDVEFSHLIWTNFSGPDTWQISLLAQPASKRLVDLTSWCRSRRRLTHSDSDRRDPGTPKLIRYSEALDRAINAILAPALSDAGFRRKSLRTREWTRDGTLQVRVQSDSKANDPYSGGSFKMEFEVSSDGRFGTKLSGRAIAEQLLDQRQRSEVLAMRNRLAQQWGPPPREHLALIPAFLHEQYLKHFSVASELECEFGMRFRTQDEANDWIQFLTRELPTLTLRAETLSPREMYLGRSLDW